MTFSSRIIWEGMGVGSVQVVVIRTAEAAGSNAGPGVFARTPDKVQTDTTTINHLFFLQWQRTIGRLPKALPLNVCFLFFGYAPTHTSSSTLTHNQILKTPRKFIFLFSSPLLSPL